MSEGRPAGDERMTKDDPSEIFRRDSTTLSTWNTDYTSFNKFREQRRDIDFAIDDMNWEKKEKYQIKYMARSKANAELRSLPKCFAHCTPELSTENNDLGDSANCIRECFFKRINAKDDLHFMYQERAALDIQKHRISSLI